MEQENLKLLIRQYIRGEVSLAELEGYDSDSMKAALEAVLTETGAKESYDAQRFEPILNNILNADKATPLRQAQGKLRKLHPMRWAAAAAVILMISISGYFYFNNNNETLRPAQADIVKNDLAPGKQGAILKLSNGKTIVLDTAQNGKLLDNFTKSNEGLTVESTDMEYATLTTPRARTQVITLSDGSKVWLNAESSIHFPTVFKGTTRTVQITGEAYFEVAKNTSMPFHVTVNDMTVEVLGTHFNINAYNEENIIRTTLLEGSVKISNKILKPGQQAQFIKNDPSSGSGQAIKIVEADIDETIAWKNGMFSFKRANIQSIMRQVARWYDVEVVFEGKIPTERYNGETSRNLNASQMLKVLEESGIKFRIEGKKIVVTN